MARRGDVAALDNIDLDDMFADEGDALFDGLDIDLDTMDDIANQNKRQKDDDDDSYHENDRPKKKKKSSKLNRKRTDELGVSINSHSTAASNSQRSSSKLSNNSTSPTVHQSIKSKSAIPNASISSNSSPQPKTKRSKSRSKLEQEKEEYFRHVDQIGIPKSDEHFYPFSETIAIPTELTLKTTKIFNTIHRMHSSFQSHLSVTPNNVTTVEATAPIVQLLQEALNSCKKPAHESGSITMGNAVAAMRTIVRDNFDRYQMASDWYNVMAILQRQYRFLKQNAENMEQYLRKNFDENDYQEIYGARSKLSEMKAPVFRVKLIFQGIQYWKDQPRHPLVASLGTTELSNGSSTAMEGTPPLVSTTTTTGGPSSSKRKQYSQLKPVERRQQVQDTLSQIVPKLSADTSSLPMADLPKLPNEIPNTKTMWKWLERYFGSLSRRQLQHYIGEMKEVVVREEKGDEDECPVSRGATNLMDRLSSLLVPIDSDDDEEEEEADDSESHDDKPEEMEVEGDDDENDVNVKPVEPQHGEVWQKSNHESSGDMEIDGDSDDESFSEVYRDRSRLDVSALSEDQVVFLMLQRHKLTEFLDPPRRKPPVKPNGAANTGNGILPAARQTSEIEDEISDLIGELHRTDEINNNRLRLLEELVQPFDERTRNYEIMLTAKCQQVLRKAKESKAKAERLEAKKKDETINTLFNLPPNR